MTHWLGLKVIKSHGTESDVTGEVEFIAKFKRQDKAYKMHERSQFVREKGHWFYLDGTIL